MGWPTTDTAEDPLMAQSCSKPVLPITPSWPSFSVHVQRRWHGIGPAPLEWGVVDQIGLAQNHSKPMIPVAMGWPTADTANDPLMAQSYPKAALLIAPSWPSFSAHNQC
jgi:hypothetical protein